MREPAPGATPLRSFIPLGTSSLSIMKLSPDDRMMLVIRLKNSSQWVSFVSCAGRFFSSIFRMCTLGEEIRALSASASGFYWPMLGRSLGAEASCMAPLSKAVKLAPLLTCSL